MTRLRVGTRGSDLALIQTRWVCEHLRRISPGLEIEEIIIATHGDRHSDQPVTDDDWPMGGFTGTIERALLEKRIDLAVHSCKDLPIVETPGTRIAAIPEREAAHDVLITSEPASLAELPENMRIGTSSPRRSSQIRRFGNVEAVPIRGNVPTRIARVGRDLDGVIVAAAGVRRLGLSPPNMLDLPLDRFLPAPGQGALAVQVRDDNDDVQALTAPMDDRAARIAVTAERALLSQLGGGCAAPVGAYATLVKETIVLRGQMFSIEGDHEAIDVTRGNDPFEIARALAQTLAQQLSEARA